MAIALVLFGTGVLFRARLLAFLERFAGRAGAIQVRPGTARRDSTG